MIKWTVQVLLQVGKTGEKKVGKDKYHELSLDLLNVEV